MRARERGMGKDTHKTATEKKTYKTEKFLLIWAIIQQGHSTGQEVTFAFWLCYIFFESIAD